MEHDLKCAPDHFAAISDGTMTAWLCKGGFEVGDVLVLREYDNNKAIQLFADADIELDIDEAWAVARPQAYTGRTLRRRVTHILRGSPEGYVMLSLGCADTTLGSDTLALLEDYKAGGTLHCTINIWDDMIARWQDALKAGA